MDGKTMVTTGTRAPGELARARALIRFNGVTFHSLAAASLLESAAGAQTAQLVRIFGAYPDVRLWLELHWLPRRSELSAQLRAYVEATWPEFDWSAAHEEFAAAYRNGPGAAAWRPGITIEALRPCVTAAQAALFYRTVAASADEPGLRGLARAAAREHATYFDFFRALFERARRRERLGFAAGWSAVFAICRAARHHDVAAAFGALQRNWSGVPIVPGMGYAEYQQRMANLIRHHVGLGPVERLLFSPWLQSERPAPEVTQERARWPQMAPILT